MAKYRKLSRTSAQRKALLRNQVTALLYYGRIETTEAKAKEIRKIAESLIALGVKEKDNYELVKEIKKDNPSRLHARRQMLKVLQPVVSVPKDNAGKKKATKKVDMVAKIFDELGPKYADRKGGYTRIIKVGPRKGDAAMMVIIELV